MVDLDMARDESSAAAGARRRPMIDAQLARYGART